MKRIPIALIAIAVPLGFTGFSLAQEAMPQQAAPMQQENAAPSMAPAGRTLGTVTSGSTTIEFRAADDSDINTQQLQTWGDFASSHPDIARTLAYKPSLVNSDEYANKHPELSAFFSAHPDVREAMAENPGNFNAIPPRPGE